MTWHLNQELHAYTRVPSQFPGDMCACGLPRAHHRHRGVSTAVCECSGCENEIPLYMRVCADCFIQCRGRSHPSHQPGKVKW